MEQISAEIIIRLRNRPAHGRELARALGTNHMAVARSLKGLTEQNALDCTTQGRNKVYSVKDTAEAKSLLGMAELVRLNQGIAMYPRLRKIVNAIQVRSSIRLAMLFGSYAKAIAKERSDIDLYVDTSDRRLRDELSQLDPRLSVKIGKFDTGNELIKEIIKDHIIIKGFEEYYEKTRGTGATKH
jgi:predicted nucleotidyltransferase